MTSGPNVLLLGSGLVAGPVVRYLVDARLRLTIAGQDVDQLDSLRALDPAAVTTQQWVAGDDRALEALMEAHEIVISLLPAPFHFAVAEACLKSKLSLITASYVSKELAALDGPAREAGVVFLGELGLDPGIDHMSAMSVIDREHADGRRVVAFRSYCGGIPAPEANDNPWGYKFSWSPAGVLSAMNNDARYLENGVVREVQAAAIAETRELLDIPEVGRLEAYANRDATLYRDPYGLKDAETIYRGTLRYPGWLEAFASLRALGLLDEGPARAKTWRGHLAARMSCADTAEACRRALLDRLDNVGAPGALQSLEFLGALEPEALSDSEDLRRSLVDLLQSKLRYRTGERDLVVMEHQLETVDAAGKARRSIKATMQAYGEPGGDSAMARTVGLPVAIAAELLVRRKLSLSGCQIPVRPEIYRPILARLAERGVALFEQTEELDS